MRSLLQRRSSLLFLFFCPLFVVCSLPSSAQGPTTGSIVGQVRIARGFFPPKKILVSLRTRGADIASTYTDDEGSFGFHQLPGNMYQIAINDPDYQPVTEAISLAPASSPVRIVTMYLTPRSEKRDVTQQQTNTPVAGGNPHIVNPAEYATQYPKEALAEFQKGVKAEKRDKADTAVRHYERAIAIAPRFYPAHNNLGTALLAKGDFPKAEQHFMRSMELNPTDASAYINMGNLRLLQKNFGEAERYTREGLRRQPDSAFGNMVLGTALQRTGRLDEAESTLRRAIELDPSMTKVHLELVNVYLTQNRGSEAISELKQFLKTAPKDPLVPKVKDLLRRLESTK
jgi:Flp pilus assembly protein TadD